MLYGKDVPVALTASLPSGAPKGYNLAFRAVLPTGTSYVASSAGNDGEPTVIANAPTSRPDHADLAQHRRPRGQLRPHPDLPGALQQHRLGRAPGSTTSATSLPITPAPTSRPTPATRPTSALSACRSLRLDSYTGSAEQTTDTSLTAIKIDKAEPHPEGEIPRGVHDHQTVYTLTVTNNDVNPTNAVSVEDWLPAGLEFLGCAGSTDHTTNAPTNAGSTQEYAGSGPIVVTHPTAAEGCLVPDLVETLDTDPDGTGPLPTDVYTHVKWNSVGNFTAGQVKTLTYAAAIPIRANTLTWSGATPSTTGAQSSNLDNNSGP